MCECADGSVCLTGLVSVCMCDCTVWSMCVSVQTIGQCVTVHTGQCVCLCRQPVNVSTVLVLRMTSVSVTAQTTGRCQHEAGFMGDQSVCLCVCVQTTGQCQCRAGFTGDQCQTPCPGMTFGLGCTQSCSVCSAGFCSKDNGTCICAVSL